LESAGFEVFRADEEQRAGDIHTDMFQELLLADLVVVDLSIDNPNVWYELGVRHALRARGVIQIKSQRTYMPFDVYPIRTLTYHVKDGAPDPETLEADRQALVACALETLTAWRGRKDSPVFHLLPYLQEPNWKLLKVGGVREFWEDYESWAQRIDLARRNDRPGDILVLADEAPTQVLRIEAYRKAGAALCDLGQHRYALEQYEKALEIEPDDLESLRQKGINLNRLNRRDEARLWMEQVVRNHIEDAESWALLGRIEKDTWVASWRVEGKTPDEKRNEATYEIAQLKESIRSYLKGFQLDPRHYYSGINALTLKYLLYHLTGAEENADDRAAMEGGVRWALHCALSKDPKDYWALATLGEIEVLVNQKSVVEDIYKRAASIAIARKHRFGLDSSRQQLLILQNLGFRPDIVAAALSVLDRAHNRRIDVKQAQPRYVFLFSGHMIDAPGRKEPRFPPHKEPIAAKAISEQLDALGAGPEDVAFCGGTCGGDLLFAEACLKCGLRLEMRIPLNEPLFVSESVTFAEPSWGQRYYQVKAHPLTRVWFMPDELGPTPEGMNPFARNNLWQLYSALAWGSERTHFLCLWNRESGDGPGGTQHMHSIISQHTGRVYVIDINDLG
jgi:tetratricopeptide (TPR) repeat protein